MADKPRFVVVDYVQYLWKGPGTIPSSRENREIALSLGRMVPTGRVIARPPSKGEAKPPGKGKAKRKTYTVRQTAPSSFMDIPLNIPFPPDFMVEPEFHSSRPPLPEYVDTPYNIGAPLGAATPPPRKGSRYPSGMPRKVVTITTNPESRGRTHRRLEYGPLYRPGFDPATYAAGGSVSIVNDPVRGGIEYKPVKSMRGSWIYVFDGRSYGFTKVRKSRPPKVTKFKLNALIAKGKLQEFSQSTPMGMIAPMGKYEAPRKETSWELKSSKVARAAALSMNMRGIPVRTGEFGDPRKSKYYSYKKVSYVWSGSGPPFSLPTNADKEQAIADGMIRRTRSKAK